MFTGSTGDGSFLSGFPRSRAEASGTLGGLLWTHEASDTESWRIAGLLKSPICTAR